jgi:hypothetical protein
LSRKAVHNWVEKFSQGGSKVADDARPGAEVAEPTVKRLLRCGFRSTGKAMGQVYQCWYRICREIDVSPTFEYHMFYVNYPFVIDLLSLPRMRLLRRERRSSVRKAVISFCKVGGGGYLLQPDPVYSVTTL